MILEVGMKLGKLELLELTKKGTKWGYICKCDCGNIKWIRKDSLTKKNPTKSCGCLAKETEFKQLKIQGKKFNNLLAIESLYKDDGKYIWKFKCDCGNTVEKPAYLVVEGKVKSCGCLSQKQILNISEKWQVNRKKIDLKDKTDLRSIEKSLSGEVISNNTSGVTGVTWDSSRGKWTAQIVFQGRRIYLGRYANKEEAIAARKEAEEKYFKPILDKYNR